MKRKILAAVLCLSMVCTAPITSFAEAADENTLTVWAWDPAFNIYSLEEAAKIYQAEHPDFAIEVVEVPWEDMQTQLATILSAGNYEELPDVFLMQDFAFQKYVNIFPDLFVDITDSGIDFTQFAENKVAASTVEGRHYGVPFDNGTEIAAYRTDILEEAGYTLEDLTDIDWNRFVEIGQDVKAKTGYSLVSALASSSDLLCQILQSAGGQIWDEEGNPYLAENEILVKSMEVYKNLHDTGVLQLANSWDEYVGTFTSGSTAGVINGCWIMASIQTSEDQAGKWGITNMPSIPDLDTATNYSNQGGSTWAISSNCKNVELAQDFLGSTFAGSKELYDTILAGAGAVSTWLPAADSEAYSEPHEFYGGQEVFTSIADYASKTPVLNFGIYYTEANTALATAVTNVCSGSDIAGELQYAQDEVAFNMGF